MKNTYLFKLGNKECGEKECVGLEIDFETGIILPNILIEGIWGRKDYSKLPEAFVGLTSHETIEYLIWKFTKESGKYLTSIHNLTGKNRTLTYAKYKNGIVGAIRESVRIYLK